MIDALAATVKALLYAAALSSAGAVFADATLRSVANRVFAMLAMRRAAILMMSACAAGIVILIYRLGGQFDSATLSAVFSSSVGAAMFMQLTAALLLLSSTEQDSTSRIMRLASAALATLSFAFNGHAATVGLFQGLFVSLHVSAAAWWVGSLWILRHACAHAEIVDIANLVRRFSVVAIRMIGGLIVTGLLLIFVLISLDDLPAFSPYERNLAIKLGFVVLVLGLAGYNKFRLTPRLLTGDPGAASTLRRMIETELIVIGVVLVATSVLTTYTSPHE